jgi:hypothetical protein
LRAPEVSRFRQFEVATLDDCLVGENLPRIQRITCSTRVAALIAGGRRVRVPSALPERGIAEPAGEEAIALFLREHVPLKLAHTFVTSASKRRSRTIERFIPRHSHFIEPAEAPLLDVANALRGMALLQETLGADSRIAAGGETSLCRGPAS